MNASHHKHYWNHNTQRENNSLNYLLGRWFFSLKNWEWEWKREKNVWKEISKVSLYARQRLDILTIDIKIIFRKKKKLSVLFIWFTETKIWLCKPTTFFYQIQYIILNVLVLVLILTLIVLLLQWSLFKLSYPDDSKRTVVAISIDAETVLFYCAKDMLTITSVEYSTI